MELLLPSSTPEDEVKSYKHILYQLSYDYWLIMEDTEFNFNNLRLHDYYWIMPKLYMGREEKQQNNFLGFYSDT